MSSKLQPTDGELEILQILWLDGPSSVREINDQLNEKRDVGYTTTLKIMQIMLEKGILTRNAESRSHIYKANIPESNVKTNMVNELINQAFHGSAFKMVMQALGNNKTTTEELKDIKDLIDKLEKK
jgi:predicted transcriptional regulator